MKDLVDHQRLYAQLKMYFKMQTELAGAFIGGSAATGRMDRYSDLDFGFVCRSESEREKIWARRFSLDLPNWFHRMDADHVKPYFIIYLFNPDIHVDLVFYTPEDLPTAAGAPYLILWDSLNGKLTSWVNDVNTPRSSQIDWSNVVHEDEQFWTWIHYSWCHLARGEYYDIASQFEFLRRIPHIWHARICGKLNFESRRLEQSGCREFIRLMSPTYPAPNLKSLRSALLALIKVHNIQRLKIDELAQPQWKTTNSAREIIRRLVDEL